MVLGFLLLKVIVGALATAAVVSIVSYVAIKCWYEEHAVSGDTVELLKKELPNAVRIHANIRGYDGKLRQGNSWQSETIDAETQSVFAGRDRVTLKVQ